MNDRHPLHFGPFRLDDEPAQLWREDREVKLRPKALAVLRYLIDHPGRLVTTDELLSSIWARTHVSRAVMKVSVRELRAALGDDASAPRFIETVGRQGYRFVADVRAGGPGSSAPSRAEHREPTLGLVGREAALRRLEGWLGQAQQGHRQMIFVTGEAGMGKSTLLEAFVSGLSSSARLRVALGQCVEHYGAGEAYLPLLDALGRTCRATGGEAVTALLRRHAPMWLAQMPALLDPDTRDRLARELAGATRERMLREMAELLEAMASVQPLVVWLDDLQWSDTATVELLASIARRRERARLMLIGSYRPVDLIVGRHPLGRIKRELFAHGQCAELPLEPLDEDAIATYLRGRLHGVEKQAALHEELVRVVHRRTDGNPLFMVNVVDYLLDRGLLGSTDEGWQAARELAAVASEIPEGLRQMIGQLYEPLSEVQLEVLTAASAAGQEFSAAAVAAAVAEDEEHVESCCEELAARGQFVRRTGIESWPDGTRTARYQFGHALYREVLYERSAPVKRARVHERIARRLEGAYGRRAREIAAQLALHFEEGQAHAEAVRYHRYAGVNAIARHAHRDAIRHLREGLAMLRLLPEGPERSRQELPLQVGLGSALLTIKGLADAEVGRVYARARELCRQSGESPRLFTVLWGLWAFHFARAEYVTARQLAERRLEIAERRGEPALLLLAHVTLGMTLFYTGELEAALRHLEQSIALYDPEKYRAQAYFDDADPGVAARAYAAAALWLHGSLDQARARNGEALTLARELSQPHTEALALCLSAWFRQLARDDDMLEEECEAALALARRHGFAQWEASGLILQGWARANAGCATEGVAQARHALELQKAAGARLTRTYWLSLLADAQRKAGDHDGALASLSEAIAEAEGSGTRYFEAELYRMKAEVLSSLAPTATDSAGAASSRETADDCLGKALQIARGQGALLLELRAAVSRVRLHHGRGSAGRERRKLAEVLGRFTEGFDTADLTEAIALTDPPVRQTRTGAGKGPTRKVNSRRRG